jgi:hypothetical protein
MCNITVVTEGGGGNGNDRDGGGGVSKGTLARK